MHACGAGVLRDDQRARRLHARPQAPPIRRHSAAAWRLGHSARLAALCLCRIGDDICFASRRCTHGSFGHGHRPCVFQSGALARGSRQQPERARSQPSQADGAAGKERAVRAAEVGCRA
mmetsp:Transcript_45606/g.126551  ORF Transcript_45606/g.126551 Transcript_45606/m.126551 type:complete len:119 (-) Transcript_45606:167-523(-)